MNIQSLIERTGKTQREIARSVGVSPSYLSMIANGQRLIGPEFLLKFSEALGVTPADLRPDLASLFLPPSDGLCGADKSSCRDVRHNTAPAEIQGAGT